MGILRAMTAVALLTLWLPATSQCFLEKAAVIKPADDCCPNSTDDSAEEKNPGSACCLLALGHYKVDSGEVLVVLHLEGTAVRPDRDEHVGVIAPLISVVDFASRWASVQQTAKLPRAPSILS